MGIFLWIGAAAFAGWAIDPMAAGAVVVAWVFWSLLPRRQQAAQAQELALKAAAQRDAVLFEVDDGGDGYSNDWTFNFFDMIATNSSGPDDGETYRRSFELKRNDRAQWRMRHTAKSRDDELALITRLNEGFAGEIEREERDARAARLVAGKWDRLDGRLETRVETAYQRYLKTL